MELLSPAGNYNTFTGAINAGCDAVYLGGSRYGARAYADNFTDEEIIKAIKVAHICHVKVYLTVNTLIKEREFDDVCNYIRPFYEAGLDGCIVQDIGLIVRFHDLFPDMECHVSTQGFATGLESVRFYKSLGATRVVLARELSLDEIKHIKQHENIELETFIHGAMCYSYSGECLFSSCLGGRSGNRGRCAGPCRLPYRLADDKPAKEQYLLSMKDQCTVEILPALIDAGIDSLKIEGRMKKPEYSAFVTSMYRKYIDLYMTDSDAFRVEHKDLDNLRHMYLRSEIWKGYYYCRNGSEMLTLDSPAYNGNDESLMETVRDKYLGAVKKTPVSMFASIIPGEPMSLTLTSETESITVYGDPVSPAQNRPLQEEDVIKQLSKLGDTCFSLDDAFVEMPEPSFVPVKSLNELRRSATEELSEVLGQKEPAKQGQFTFKVFTQDKTLVQKPIVTVHTMEQFEAASKFDDIYVGVPCELFVKNKLSGDNLVLITPDVVRIKDYKYVNDILKHACDNGFVAILVRNYEVLHILEEGNFDLPVILGSEIYIANGAALEFAEKTGTFHVAPLELSYHELSECYDDHTYIFAYGKLPLMHAANCVVKTTVGCRKHQGETFTYIKDRTDTVFPVYRNCDTCSNIIYNSVPTYLFEEIRESRFSNDRVVLSFTDEDKETVKNIISLFVNNSGNAPDKFTKAYWKRGVE
ncbi:MAG: U32 family peptidase [Lachnospiraceae bacterium]|nr:U32 family peptidase [Lachnospiraceae bacterium]